LRSSASAALADESARQPLPRQVGLMLLRMAVEPGRSPVLQSIHSRRSIRYGLSMASSARKALRAALADVDALIADHAIVTGGGRGKPAGGRGRELTRAAVVLLAGAVEGFVEDLFNATVDLIHAHRPAAQLKKFKKETSGRLNNADSAKTNALFAQVGLPWVLEGVRWQKFSNDSFIEWLDSLVTMRNKIAHGRAPKRALLVEVKAWRKMTEKYADRLERILAAHIQSVTGSKPTW